MERLSEMLTVHEVATALGITDRAVRYRLDKGIIKGHRVGVWLWLVSPAELERAKANPPKLGRKPTRRPPLSDD